MEGKKKKNVEEKREKTSLGELAIIIMFNRHGEKKKKALAGFEPAISCLLDRRFNQLSHRANRV